MYWKIRFRVKIIAGRIPVFKRVLRKLGYFRHGRMDSIAYASGVFKRHVALSSPALSEKPGGTCMELGPGDSLLTLIFARAAGFERTLLIDQGRHASADTALYASAADECIRRGRDVPRIGPHWTLEDVLRAYRAEYLTDGLRSLREVPSRSVDFSFSHAVLEHLPRNEAEEYLIQLRRISKCDSISSHVVDLRDHLGGSIQHLRFDEKTWESEAVRRSGVYTNRMRFSQWSALFGRTGWDFRIVERQRFPALPVPRAELDGDFAGLDDDDLRTHGFHAVLRAGESR